MRARRLVLMFSMLLAALGAVAQSAFAAGPPAWWRLSSTVAPTNLAPGTRGLLEVAAGDLGSVGISGVSSPVTITDELPAGLRVSSVEGVAPRRERKGVDEKAKSWKCTVSEGERVVTCTTSLAIPPYERYEMEIPIEAVLPAGTQTKLPNRVSVQGGEAQGSGLPVTGASLERPVSISDEPVTFGVEEEGYSLVAENPDGSLDTAAGSHPYQLTSTVQFNQIVQEIQEPGSETALIQPAAPGLPKNLSFQLPTGLLGDVTATPQCTQRDFGAVQGPANQCPTSSVVGVANVTLQEPNRLTYSTLAVPVFNLEPSKGEPARFGFEAFWVPVVLDTSVRTDGDYGVTVSVENATEAAQVLAAQVTFWGSPGDQSHDASRGWACLREGLLANFGETCEPPNPRPTHAFLTLPTACETSLVTEMGGTSWNGQPLGGEYRLQGPSGAPLAHLEGCASLPFEPSLGVEPVQPEGEGHPEEHTTSASTPTGLDVDVRMPQLSTLEPDMLGEAAVRSATVTLPQGMVLNPAAANGLAACSQAEVGYQGPGGGDPFAPGSVEPLRFSSSKAQCPAASKVGTVRIKTPLLGEELTGSLYLAEQEHNPFGSLIALYIVAESEQLGLTVKLAGRGELDETTGQVTTVFEDTPQVPFEELHVQLFGGPGASLGTPAHCGNYSASGSFTPWSSPAAVNVASDPGAFTIATGPGGAPCPSGQLPFAPSFQAGSTSPQAGAFTNFSLQLTNPDGDQPLSGLTMHLPAGAAAVLAHVTPCPEPQASENQCGAESLVGSSLASSGLGPDPVQLPGEVYLTGPYEGGPFGLAVVTPAVAGPFNLGDVTVRSRITVDPHTAQVTITSDPFPTFVKGIPVELKQIQVQVNRPNFEYNPTSCNTMSIQATLTGAEATNANVSSPFQVSGCQNLPFKPAVSATTQGQTSKADGASLGLTFKSKSGEAHVAKTILTIPATLPARLTTIQKACVASVFEANPAACPEGSDIGAATVHTPVLKSPLTGPIYLVSHGNAAWPDAELVLQGEGITVILDGQTAIRKGVTTSSFLSVPDAPFESVEATLPEGPHSALTTNLPLKDKYSLCGQKLTIPTALTGQNATAVDENVKVTVQGCHAVKASKAKKLTRAQKLARALKICRRRYARSHARRAACERAARKRYAGRATRRKR
ncbi:MAG TPA: hypothetical protein VMB51_04655 [Solirubrobacteraceae bacterium]|nr:hypothetical protein [Solirubrobacteraceae bacterium]